MISASPPRKRIKLESRSPQPDTNDEEEYNCSICLQPLVDRTVIPTCSHEFCFDCLVVWTDQSRKCPLCAQTISEYLIHRIRSRYDYQKHYLAPLSKPGLLPLRAAPQREHEGPRRQRRRDWGRRDQDEADKLERSIETRRWVYEHGLYAKHVASNGYTKYRPYPTPAQFSASQEMVSKTTMFLRRELRVWDDLDVEFFTMFTISLMKSIDIRSESAVKLLAEFLDMDTGGRTMAEHFAHEVYSYVRSPFKDLFVYDSAVQYDTPPHLLNSPVRLRQRRWHEIDEYPRRRSGSRSGSPRDGDDERSVSSSSPRDKKWREHEASPARSISWSPSGRYYPSTSRKSSPFFAARTPAPNETEATKLCRSTSLSDDKGKSRATDESDSDTPSAVVPAPDAKGKSRADSPYPPLSNFPEAPCRRSNKRIRTALDSVRAHLGAGPSSSPNLLSRLSSGRERRDGSADTFGRSPSSGPTPGRSREPDSLSGRTNDSKDSLTQGRARLLGKLLEERRKASRPAATMDDVERRLRSQALVRVRLAAEKRARQ